MGANKIYLQVDFQDSDADAQIKKLNQEIAAIGETSQKATQKSEQSFKSFGVSIEETQHAVFGLGEAIASLAALQLAREMVEVADKINRVEISLETLTGSAQVAADTLRSIREIAAKSPFAFEDLAAGARNLAAFGLEASKIPADIKAISAAAAALGGSADMVEHLTQTIGMMYEKDEANSRFLFRGLLKERLPVLAMVRAALQKSTGTLYSEDKIKEMVEHQQLAGRKLADALLEGMQDRYKDSDKVMGLVSTQITKLTDDIKELAEVVVRDLAPSFNAWIEQLRELMKWFRELPEPMRKLIEFVVELGAAVSILGVAWKVLSGLLEATGILKLIGWLTELGGEIELVTATSGTLGEALAGWAMAAVPAGISIMGIVTALGTLGLMIGTFLATNKLIDWLEDVRVKAEAAGGMQDQGLAAIVNLFTYGADQRRHDQEGMNEYLANLEKRNQLLRAQAVKVAPFATNALPPLPALATEEATTAIDAQNRQLADIILAAHKHLNDDLLKENQAAMEQLDQMTAAALDKARAKASGGIAAIDDDLAEAYRKIAKVAHPFTEPTATLDQDLARLAQARQLRIDQVVEAAEKQSLATRRELDQKAAEDRITDMKKASDLEVELARQTGSETMEARAAAQAQGYAVLIANEEKTRAAQKAATSARQQAELDEYRSHISAKEQIVAPEMIAQHIADVEARFRGENEKADLESYQRVAKYRVDVEKSVLEETRQLNEAAFQLQNQNQLDRAQHQGELIKAAVDAIPAQTEEAKTAQAQAGAKAQIDAVNLVYNTQLTLDQALYDDRQRALQTQMENAEIAADTYYGKLQAMDQEQIQNRQHLDQDRIFETQKLEIEAMKKHNEAVIADQKQVYDQIKSGVDKVWDAMTGRAGTFAERIGNMLKSAFAEAAKSIVTSHVSAALTEMFGKGHVGFGGGGLRQALGKEPIFGADKMQAPGHLGDVTTVSAAGYQAVPVWMLNPSTVDQHITQNVHISTPEKAATVTSAAALISLGAAVAGRGGGGSPFVTSSATFGGSGDTGILGMLSRSSQDTLQAGGYGGGGGAIFGDGSILGGPGGTSGFAGPLAGYGGLSSGGASSPLGGFGGVLGKLGGNGSGAPMTAQIGNALLLAAGAGLLGAGLKQNTKAVPSGIMSTAGGGILGMQAASLLGTSPLWSGVLGAGIGLSAAGLMRGGLSGLGMDVGGGALIGLQLGGPIGALIGAGVGAIAGGIRMLIPGAAQKVRSKIKQVYGVDISQQNVLMQIVQLAKDHYGGNLDVAIASPEVQDLVRLYSIATGKNPSGLPRPMYAATFTQSGAGGVNLQPVYQSGNVVANPYSGVTSTQYAQLGSQLTYLQLDPTQALSLLSGQVTGVMAQNPGNVAAANAAALASGNSRDAQNNALFEPLTVMS